MMGYQPADSVQQVVRVHRLAQHRCVGMADSGGGAAVVSGTEEESLCMEGMIAVISKT